MNRRGFLQKSGIGILVFALGSRIMNAHSQQTIDEKIDSKISPDLIRMVKEGNYPIYKNTALVDVMIKYSDYPWSEDLAAIRDIGGVRGDIANSVKGVRAGLPTNLEKIREYASRTRVIYIGPNIDGKDFFDLK